jgi:hypothetical protein
MSDFRDLLKQNTDEIKRPPPTPAGTWFGLVTNQEFGESRDKKTPYCRYTVRLTNAGADISADEDLSQFIGKEYTTDYYLTEGSLYRLSEMIKSCKIMAAGRPLDETIPEVVGKEVMVTIAHERPKNLKPTDPPYSRLVDMVGKSED